MTKNVENLKDVIEKFNQAKEANENIDDALEKIGEELGVEPCEQCGEYH